MSVTTKTRSVLALAAASLSLGALAGPASAADNTPTLPAAGCIVSIDGHDHTVPAGTVVMGLVCGTDGDWHFPKAAQPTNPKLPVTKINHASVAAYSLAA
jgi:hypothetical protein